MNGAHRVAFTFHVLRNARRFSRDETAAWGEEMTMKKWLGTALVGIATGVSGAALAADMPVKAPAYKAAPPFNWTGFYAGGFIGGAFGGSTDLHSTVPGGPYGGDRPDTFFGGGQLGFNYQFAPNWVAGIEGDIGGGSNADRVVMHPNPGGPRGPILHVHASDWLASLTGRLGYTWGPGIIYAKAGVAFRGSGSFDNIALPAFTVDEDTTGYTLGAGFEYMFAPAWSAKIEYQYYNFGRTAVNDANLPIETLSYRDDIHAVKAGINYHFGSR